MDTVEIQKKVKYVNDAKGKPVEVILPYKIYQKLLELQISLEIYHQEDVQQSIRQAKRDVENGNIRSFKNMDEAVEWLDK